MRTKLRVLLIVALCIFILAGCGSGDDKSDSSGNGTYSTKVTDSVSKDDTGKQNSSSSDVTPIGGQKLDLGDLSSETLPISPKETTPSMYFYNAKELDEEVFFPDNEEIYGDPYYFNGTITEELEAGPQLLSNYNELGALMANNGADLKLYKVMTQYGEVLMMDTVPVKIKYINDNLKSQTDSVVYGLAYLKTWYNNLMPYKNMPEVGDTAKFYGFLYGYSHNYDCPLFSYGVGNLARLGFFEEDYAKYRSDEVKKKKYRSLFNYSYPVGWSEVEDSGGDMYIYFPENLGYMSIRDIEFNDMTLEEAISYYLGEEPMDMPDFGDFGGDEDMPPYDPSEWIKVKNKEKITIGDGSVTAYHIDVSFKYDDGTWSDETIVAFKAKRSVVILEVAFYDNPAVDEDYEGTSFADNTPDYLDEEEDESEEDNLELNVHGNDIVKLRNIVLDEFDKLLKSVEILGL